MTCAPHSCKSVFDSTAPFNKPGIQTVLPTECCPVRDAAGPRVAHLVLPTPEAFPYYRRRRRGRAVEGAPLLRE